MGRIFSFLGLLIVLAVGAYIYTQQAKSVVPEGAGSIRQTVDITGVRNDLLAIANAERSQFALEGKYLPLDELRSKGVINIAREGRAGYTYSVEVGDTSFRVVAGYSGPPLPGAPQTITLDETMQFQQQ